MTDIHISTVALSVHNAIAAMNRPCSASNVAHYLRRIWHNDVSDADIAEGVAALQERGSVTVDGDLIDTRVRNARGERIMICERNEDGWF